MTKIFFFQICILCSTPNITLKNILKVLKSSHEFVEFNNRRFSDMFPIEFRKEAEEELLYANMQTDLVQQLMRRLASVKSL